MLVTGRCVDVAETLRELRSLPDEELVRRHDELAGSTVVGTKHYLDELHRRDQMRMTHAMLTYTRWIMVMTLVMTIATLVNVAGLLCR